MAPSLLFLKGLKRKPDPVLLKLPASDPGSTAACLPVRISKALVLDKGKMQLHASLSNPAFSSRPLKP